MINVKAYTPVGNGKYRLRWRVRGRQQDWVCTALNRCVCWADLIRLAKWHIAQIAGDLTARCPAKLASWAWDLYGEENWSATCGEACKQDARESRDGLGCWCGKYRSETA